MRDYLSHIHNIVVTIRDQRQRFDGSYLGTVESQFHLFYVQNTRRINENI
jgi:hypothetical protein